MSNAKLMTPLFYQGNYNTGGKKMRALMIREVTNGIDTYRLWRRDGKPDRQYPQGKGDDYTMLSGRWTWPYLHRWSNAAPATASLPPEPSTRSSFPSFHSSNCLCTRTISPEFMTSPCLILAA